MYLPIQQGLGILTFASYFSYFFKGGYLSLDVKLMPVFLDRVYFSVFHAISAFCNAGFSTLPNGMMEAPYVFNYPLQLIIIAIFVFGGLGLTVIKSTEESDLLGRRKTVSKIQGIPEPSAVLEKSDVIVIFGEKQDLQKFVK